MTFDEATHDILTKKTTTHFKLKFSIQKRQLGLPFISLNISDTKKKNELLSDLIFAYFLHKIVSTSH